MRVYLEKVTPEQARLNRSHGDMDGVSNGKRIVLPSSFTGGPRYMIQYYQDAISICRHKGIPDLFITFTCNPKWAEIQTALDLIPEQHAEDRPDIVARVFHMKLTELMKVLRQGKHFGTVTAAIYTIEFQKRGLPHAHILLFLDAKDKPQAPSEIDRIISAELPDEKNDPEGYKAVVQFMLHGPCGIHKPDQKCMKNYKCTKYYPKEFNSQTTVDGNGYPVYRRRQNNVYAHKDGVDLSNQWVIPHNRDLIVQFDAHINVEVCNGRGSLVKYLFKYIMEGRDRVTAVIEKKQQTPAENQEENPKPVEKVIDEIYDYLDCRYISPPEACWRILDYDIHY